MKDEQAERMAREMAEEELANRYRAVKNRTIDTIIPRLLFQISSDRTLSGNHEMSLGVMSLVNEYNGNKKFGEAMKVVAETILTTFPPEGVVSHPDLNDDDEEPSNLN